MYRIGNNDPDLGLISVSSNGLICSVGMLFIMLIILVLGVIITNWHMNKLFGIIMLLAYLSFCVVASMLEMDYIVCPLRIGLCE
jgi:Ca2+/Na+ antiporter